MSGQRFFRVFLVGAIAMGLLAIAAPAVAQNMGSLRGLVTDEMGQPVPDAEITFSYVGDLEITVTLKTNDKGEFARSGLRTGQWKMTATKGELTGSQMVRVNILTMTRVDTLVIKMPVKGQTDTSGMTAKEVEERNKKMKEMQTEFEAAIAEIDTNPDDAITKLTAVSEGIPNCAICFSKIGDANMKKGDLAAAEAAFKKAIELDKELADPYAALAVLYNQQKKFDEATEMSQKANELLGASETGGDPAALYNQGIILWNAGKYPEAKAQFEKVVALDPKMADAFYQLGMANVNLGQLPDAVKAFEEYLKLAPDGQNAETAKAILKQIK